MSLFVLVFFYSQAASKAGFVLSPAAGKKGDFQALKLGQIDITVRATGGVNLLTSLKVFLSAVLSDSKRSTSLMRLTTNFSPQFQFVI